MSDLRFVSWKEVFEKAMEETDRDRLVPLVAESDLAIFHRQQKLYACPQHREELSAMNVASEALGVVKRTLTKPTALPCSLAHRLRSARFVRHQKTA
jgi:hypothetical protein